MESVFRTWSFSYSVKIAPKDFFGDFFAHLRDHFIPHQRNNYHPHIFGGRLTSLLAVLLVTVKIFSVSYLTLGPALPVFSSAITAENVLDLTNESRKSFGINTLAQSPILAKAAEAKAKDMAEKSYFSHVSPDGRLPWNFIHSAGYNYIMAGENLAVNFTEAESLEQAWMNSEAHKANILNKNFEEVGIGIAQGYHGGKTSIFVVQMFGVPAQQNIVLQNEPTQVQTEVVPKVAEIKIPSLAIAEVKTEVQAKTLAVSVTASDTAVKVLALYGKQAAWLYPRPGGVWEAKIPLEKLTASQSQLSILAFNLEGEFARTAVATFAPSVLANYDFSPKALSQERKLFGQSLNLKNFQDRFYLLFLAGILTSLCLAIAIKRHIQHLTLVANGSLVAILAVLLWMG